jgi:hypothetical protein
MWADTLLAAEQAHLYRLALWAMASVLVGTAVFALPSVRRGSSALLRHFALQLVIWGVVERTLVWVSASSVSPRDLAGARQLERMLWLNCGLDTGYVAVGLTIAIACWVLGRRMGGVGAGVAILTHGVGLLWLHVLFVGVVAGVS